MRLFRRSPSGSSLQCVFDFTRTLSELVVIGTPSRDVVSVYVDCGKDPCDLVTGVPASTVVSYLTLTKYVAPGIALDTTIVRVLSAPTVTSACTLLLTQLASYTMTCWIARAGQSGFGMGLCDCPTETVKLAEGA